MDALDLAAWLRFGLAAWVALLAGCVVYRALLLPGRLPGLLSPSRAERTGPGATADRLQMLLVFLVALAGYAFLAGEALADAERLESLPEAPMLLVAAFAGSQGIYLGGKVARVFGRGLWGEDSRWSGPISR